MAPSSGHHLVPHALRIIKFAVSKTTALLRSQLSQSSTISNSKTSDAILQTIRIHSNSQQSLSHPIIRQSRWFSTAFGNSGPRPHAGVRYDRSSFPGSKVSKALIHRGAAPFASTLRPSLTGGALPRSAGGYSLGGTGIAGKGARHFSHTPGVQAQVVQNVSAGIRAFVVGGKKVRFDGLDAKTGEKRFKSVSRTEDQVMRKLEQPLKAFAKGTSLEFQLSPTITALSTKFFSTTSEQTLDSPDLLFNLSMDFSHALKDFTAILSDLRRLSTLGALPITLSSTSSGPMLTCRFPGCDAQSVTRLCDEVGIQRGIVREDEAWTRDHDSEMALLFPFAPGADDIWSDDGAMIYEPRAGVPSEQLDRRELMTSSELLISAEDSKSNGDLYDQFTECRTSPSLTPLKNYPMSTGSGYESLCSSDFTEDSPYVPAPGDHLQSKSSANSGTAAYEGVVGMYRFLKECEDARL